MDKVILFIGIFCIFQSCATIKIKCNSGEYNIYRNPEKAYAKYASSWDFGLKGTLEFFGKWKISEANAELKKDVERLYVQLSNYTSRNQDLLMTSFMTFSSAICDSKIRDKHQSLLDNIAEQSKEIAIIEANLLKEYNKAGLDGRDEIQIKNDLQKLSEIVKN